MELTPLFPAFLWVQLLPPRGDSENGRMEVGRIPQIRHLYVLGCVSLHFQGTWMSQPVRPLPHPWDMGLSPVENEQIVAIFSC